MDRDQFPIFHNIDKLRIATINRKIEWTKSNPTTYISKVAEQYVVSIQSVLLKKDFTDYELLIFRENEDIPCFSSKKEKDPNLSLAMYHKHLKFLYDSIKKSVEDKGLDALQSVVDFIDD
ncbi:MAG: hypothetical protein ISR55_10550 [Bacteroidetes bacterium]|nr:hypothetical protein [Bacteroidota bacterium]MBL6964254.1 hypothetical protein [Bacteroidota bacterium]